MTKIPIPEGHGRVFGAVDPAERAVAGQRAEAEPHCCVHSPEECAQRTISAERVGQAVPAVVREAGKPDEKVVSTEALPSGLFVEPPMSDADLACWTTKEELAEAAAFGAGRRREWLSWRALVRRELGADAQIAYNDAGAPVVTNRSVHIGVSHCAGRIAVLFSDKRCAVDIEPGNRDFLRAASRYLAPEERRLSSDELLPGVVWCAKEALYKYAGRTELDLLRDIRIREVDLAAGRIAGCVAGDEPLRLTLLRRDGYILVFVC